MGNFRRHIWPITYLSLIAESTLMNPLHCRLLLGILILFTSILNGTHCHSNSSCHRSGWRYPPPPVVDGGPALILVEAPPPPHADTSVNDDVPPYFEATVNGKVLQDNDSLIGEKNVTSEHHSSDGSTVSDSLLGVNSFVHGVPVISSNDLSLLLVRDIQLLVDEELQNIRPPGEGPSI